MAYETKVLLLALAEITLSKENAEEVYHAIAKLANAEGVILKPYGEAKAELGVAKKSSNDNPTGQ